MTPGSSRLADNFPAFRTPVTEKVLWRLYDHFNKLYFNNELPKLEKLFINKTARRFLGRAHLRWSYDKSSGMGEFIPSYWIEISKFIIGERAVVCNILLHEMIHIWQYVRYAETRDDKYLDPNAPLRAHGHYFHQHVNRLNREGFDIPTTGGDDTVAEMEDYAYGLAVYGSKDPSMIGIVIFGKKYADIDLWRDVLMRKANMSIHGLELFKTKTSRVMSSRSMTPKRIPRNPKIFMNKKYADTILESPTTEILEVWEDTAEGDEKFARTLLNLREFEPYKYGLFRTYLAQILKHSFGENYKPPMVADGDTEIEGVPQTLIKMAYTEWSTTDYQFVSGDGDVEIACKHIARFVPEAEPPSDAEEMLDAVFEKYEKRGTTKEEFGELFIKRLAFHIHKKYKSTSKREALDLAELMVEDTEYLP